MEPQLHGNGDLIGQIKNLGKEEKANWMDEEENVVLQKARELLQDTESRFRNLVQSSPTAIYFYRLEEDNRLVLTGANPAADRIIGISHQALIGKTIEEAFPNLLQTDIPELYRKVARRETGTQSFDIPYKDERFSGYYNVNVFSIADNEIAVDFIDISDRRKIEEALIQERKLLRTVLDNLPVAIYVKDKDARKVLVNRTDIENIGLPESEIIGKKDEELFDAETYRKSSADDQNVISTGVPILEREELLINQKGQKIWVSTSKVPLHNAGGEIIGLVGIGIDISHRKEGEIVVQDTLGKLNALFSSMTELVVLHELVFDEKGNPVNYRITDCNAAFTKSTGITKEEAVGKLATDLYQVPEAPYLEPYSRVAITGESYQFETYFPPMEKHFSISVVSPSRNKFATVTSDITELKQTQQIITAKNKELEQIVYVASHDLRSPLVNVDGYSRELEFSLNEILKAAENGSIQAEQLEKTLQNELPEMVQALNHIRNSTRQMDSLLKGLLKLSRSGKASLNIGPVDMNESIRQVCSSFEFQIKNKGIELNVGNLPDCRGDEVQLVQVFTNLVDNAIKYLDPERPGKILITGKAEFGRSEYCITDNGIGIAENHQDKIFELFHRLNPDQGSGEGLGLTIVRQILSRMDGEIRVESKLGEGSKFTIMLPYGRKL